MPRAPRMLAGKPYDRPRSGDGKWVHDRAPSGVSRSVVIAGSALRAQPTARLVVSNLHYEVTARDLISIFGQIGTLVRDPDIKYDRSGRSTGVAIIQFETVAEATRAKNQYNKHLAKGQPMEISYDARPVKQPGSGAKSLLNRISKPPLLERLGPSSAVPKDTQPTPTEPVKAITNGGRSRTRGARRVVGTKGEKVRKEPKSAADLDKELEAFMNDDSSKPAESAVASAPLGDADVEMAA